MPEIPKPSPTTPIRASALVVLLAPDIIGDRGLEALCITISSGSSNIRLLFRIARPADLKLVAPLMAFGLPMQLLLSDEVSLPNDVAHIPHARVKGCKPRRPDAPDEFDEIDELALALSDVVVFDEELVKPSKLFRRANASNKLTIPLGHALPAFSGLDPGLTSGLDPQIPRWWVRGPGLWGRFEQIILEFLACNRSRLKRCFRYPWGRAYFAPTKWKKWNPDKAAVADSAPIVARFDALDRSALRGSYKHRDLIWFVHISAAFAVFAAVSGEITDHLGEMIEAGQSLNWLCF